jgi:RHS repeat-associated protein
MTRQTTPDLSVITPSYNEAGMLNSESILHNGDAAATIYIKEIDYNEKGQRCKIIYGNNVTTKFYYDKQTFRLNRSETKKQDNDRLQDLYYTFDAIGNITHAEDKNIPEFFFDNRKTSGVSEYTYDALYRLVSATGRENDKALNFGDCDNWNDKAFIRALNPGDPIAPRSYTETYQYDQVGNIKEMKHVAPGGSWTRNYEYEKTTNRLINTRIGDNGAPQTYTEYHHHTQHGFLTELPHLENISWNFKEEIFSTHRQHCTEDTIPVITYYQYDGQGQRIRKITENGTSGGAPTKKEERIYVEGYELYKKHSGADAGLERVSLSLLDEGHRFVMIETRNDIDDGTEKQLTRYQLNNHHGSVVQELNAAAEVISYEEFHPFGTTAYKAQSTAIKAAAKRYRFTGMERDEETGLEYHSARYYVPWLGRWLSCDPTGIRDGVNMYCYCKNDPIKYTDKAGKQAARVTGSERIVRALEEADRANFSDESVNNALEAIDAEISSRGIGYYFTRDAVMAHALLRAEAYARHARQGNYGRAAFHGTLGVIDSFGYTLFGNTPGETAQNVAIAMIVGAALNRLSAAARAAQLEAEASSEALASRVAARQNPTPPAAPQGNVAPAPAPPAPAAPAPAPQNPPSILRPPANVEPPAPRPGPVTAPAEPVNPATPTRTPARAVPASPGGGRAPAQPATPPAEPTAPSGPRYRIGEGVRRSVAERELGRPDVEAIDATTGQPLGRIPLDQLYSPKGSIVRDPRFQSVLRGAGGGNPPGVAPPPPIEVYPMSPTAPTGGLTPVPQVRLVRYRP